MTARPPVRRLLGLGAILALVSLGGCGEDPMTAPDPAAVSPAKGGNGNGGGKGGGGSADPTVDATDPASASQNRTLDIHVFGSNYEDGSQVALLLNGVATGKVTTNSTAFISERELVANVTIAADAEPDLYDVQVTTPPGKKGVGIELFEVVTTADLLTAGDGVVGDGAIYFDDGTHQHVTNRFRLQPDCDDARSMSLVNVIPAGYPSNQSTCNGGPEDGWAFLHLPDLLTIHASCGGAGEAACPFALLPAFEKGKNWEKNGIIRPTGGFAPSAHYYQRDLNTGQPLDFVFQDARVVLNADGTMTFTATEAHFYFDQDGGGLLCEGDTDGDPETIDDCTDVAVPIEIRVRPGS